jgi:CBS domain-containing protein
MKSILQILREKTRPLATVSPGMTVHEAVELMAKWDIGAVVVMEGAQLVGIFTERDCLHKIALPNRSTRETKVADVMTRQVRFATPQLTVSECLALMTERRFRHLPVLDDDHNVIGMISIGDLVKAKIDEQVFVIDQLERYIMGDR